MVKNLIAITDCELPRTEALETLRGEGYEVVEVDSRRPEDIIRLAREASGLVVQWADITAEIMDELPRLRIISRLGIGCDMIDVPAATARGVAVANTPSYCIEEVATHTLAMILSLVRGLPAHDAAMKAGEWEPTRSQPMADRPSATCVAVIGYGRIGRLVAQYCSALGLRVVVSDPFVEPETIARAGLQAVTFEQALDRADVLTLHVPLTDETHHVVGESALARLRQGAVLVNTCRGQLVDEDALVRSLSQGHLGAAALDVYEQEPLADRSPLRDLQNVLLSPHAAWHSPEAIVSLPRDAVENVRNFFGGEQGSANIINTGYSDALVAE